MLWSNKFNLPQPLVSAVQRDPYQKAGDISVTSLIKAPRMRILEDRHDSEITIDVSDRRPKSRARAPRTGLALDSAPVPVPVPLPPKPGA